MTAKVPTTPGIYMAAGMPVPEFDPYILTKDGEWFEMNQEGWSPMPDPVDFLPLTPLLTPGTVSGLPSTHGAVIRFGHQFGVWQLYKSGLWQNTVTGKHDPVAADVVFATYGPEFTILDAGGTE